MNHAHNAESGLPCDGWDSCPNHPRQPDDLQRSEPTNGSVETDWKQVHRDLTRRLGFGDDITEPMADNDTIVAWFDEQSRDASEWRESQRWRDECYAAGHPTDEDCWEHDPALRLQKAEDEIHASSVRLLPIAATLIRASYSDDVEQLAAALGRGSMAVKAEVDRLRKTRVTPSGGAS